VDAGVTWGAVVVRTGGGALDDVRVTGGGTTPEVDAARVTAALVAGVTVAEVTVAGVLTGDVLRAELVVAPAGGAVATDAAAWLEGALTVERADVTRAAGRKAGRAVCVGRTGTASRASAFDEARVMLSATTAHPATASDAATAETIRPTYMWLVCQVGLM
jgi:hypothetical protein